MTKFSSPFTEENTNEKCVSFVRKAFEFASKNNKKIIFKNKPFLSLNKGEQCTGYCNEEGIVVAYKHDLLSSFKTFVHEFCHLEQMIENTKEWQEWEWVNFRSCKIPSDYSKLKNSLKLEHDCEKRAIKYISNLHIVDIEQYIKESNSYFYFMQFSFLKKKWLPLYAKHQKEYDELVNQMPKRLVSFDSLSKIDMDIMMMFEKVFFN